MSIKSNVARTLSSEQGSHRPVVAPESPQLGNHPPFLQTVSLLTPYYQNSYWEEEMIFVRAGVGFNFTDEAS